MNGDSYKMEHDHIHALDLAKSRLPKDELLFTLADLFKIFGDTTRVKILFSLFEEELCVREITELLGMTQSAVSHQLKVLKDSKLIGNRREGKTIIYFLADNHVRSIIGQGFEHILEDKADENDL